MSHPKVLGFVLAGGKGERLFPLTAMRSKPSVPFGGKYRIIDFVLSNFLNSNIFSLYLLVQYKSQSLIEHVRKNWVLSPVVRDHFIAVVPPQMRMGPEWFQGTADAVFQNVNLIHDNNAELVIIFGADHIYRMDIRQMVDFHIRKGADVTVAARPVPRSEASAFGVIATDDNQRITGFLEKPKDPPHMPGRPDMSFASMGNYIFNRNILLNSLSEAQRNKQHDFGSHILPALVGTHRVFAYDFGGNEVPGMKPYEELAYWRDVGTISSFFDSHMDLLGDRPKFDLNNRQWPIKSGGSGEGSARITRGTVENSMLAEGVVIDGGTVRNSVLRRGVMVESGAQVENCIVMDHVVLKKNCRLKNVIIDKSNIVDENEVIGVVPEEDRFSCHIDAPSGIAILPKGGRRSKRSSV